jgi:hypothetical protein
MGRPEDDIEEHLNYQDELEREAEERDPEEESLAETPEAMDWLPDGRDCSKEPPAELDVLQVMKLRQMILKPLNELPAEFPHGIEQKEETWEAK